MTLALIDQRSIWNYCLSIHFDNVISRAVIGACVYAGSSVGIKLNDILLACVRFSELAYTQMTYLTNVVCQLRVAAPSGNLYKSW